jgi:hypothetical protein
MRAWTLTIVGRHWGLSRRAFRFLSRRVYPQANAADITTLESRMSHGGMKVDQARRLKELEKENARLKRLLADAELDEAILKEAATGKY